MAGTFQDGFPLDPIQAVQAATFLSSSERDEWMGWLNSASPEDKTELVNTLHEIWVENKSSTPAPQTATPAPQAVTPAPQTSPLAPQTPAPVPVPAAPELPKQAVPAQVPLPPPVVPPPAPAPQSFVEETSKPAPATSEPKPEPVPMPELKKEEPAMPPKPVVDQPLPKVEQPKYSFKAVDEPNTNRNQNQSGQPRDNRQNSPQSTQNQPPRGNQNQNRNDNRSSQSQPPRDNRYDRAPAVQTQSQNQPQPTETKPATVQKQSNFVDLNHLQTDKTRSILDEFIKSFKSNRQNELDQITKLTEAVIGVEEVVNYSDLLAEKILALNTAQIKSNQTLTKEQEKMHSDIDDVRIHIDDVKSMVEHAQEEIDRVARRQRSFESEVKDTLSKVKEQISGFNANQFSGEDTLAIISRRLDRMENVRNVESQHAKKSLPSVPQTHSETPTMPESPKPLRTQLSEMQVDVPSVPPRTTNDTSNFMPIRMNPNKGSIDEDSTQAS